MTPSRGTGRPGSNDPQRSRAVGVGGWLNQARLQGEAGEVGAASAASLVPDPIQVGADRADAHVQLGGNLPCPELVSTRSTGGRRTRKKLHSVPRLGATAYGYEAHSGAGIMPATDAALGTGGSHDEPGRGSPPKAPERAATTELAVRWSTPATTARPAST